MSKCIKCGTELNTGGTLEIYSGMCGKCYEEQYDKFVKKIYGKYLFGVIEKPLRQQIDQLKQQLAEKEKELTYMTKQAKKFNNEAQKYYEDAYCNGLQNQKAIAELEKVKDWLNEPFDEDGCFKIGVDLIDFIDQQIKELKEERYGKRLPKNVE